MPRLRFPIAWVMFAVALCALDCAGLRSFVGFSGRPIVLTELVFSMFMMLNLLVIGVSVVLVRNRQGKRSPALGEFLACSAVVSLLLVVLTVRYPLELLPLLRITASLFFHVETYTNVILPNSLVRGFNDVLGILFVSFVYMIVQCLIALAIFSAVRWFLESSRIDGYGHRSASDPAAG
jgi:hypothetical protein